MCYGNKMRATKITVRTTRFQILVVLRVPTFGSNFATLHSKHTSMNIGEQKVYILAHNTQHNIMSSWLSNAGVLHEDKSLNIIQRAVVWSG